MTQTTNMDAEARSQFLDHFRESVEPVVGFAILGGIFSEGIDLTGDQLIGAAIVSVGLPGLNSETNRLRDYFDRKNGNGFAYATSCPASTTYCKPGAA